MRVTLRGIDCITPYENNPRKNDQAVEAVAKSIAEFGFRQPIVVDEAGVIVVGNTRYKAALRLGLEKVPVHVATGLTPAQIKAYRLADNQTGSIAEWDEERLVQELLDLQGMNFAIDGLGFSAEELGELIGAAQTEGQTDVDDVPEPPDQAITQPGDLWTLGNHRLLCGDSSKPEQVDRLVDGAPDPSGQHGSPLWGSLGAPVEQCDRGRVVVVPGHDAPPEVRPGAPT